MSFRLYDTLKRDKLKFSPSEGNTVRFYVCGPTVYNYAHIGNYRSYIFSDLLRRYFKFKGFQVNEVMNITDVDDKTIRDSKKEGVALKDFTARYEKAFHEDLHSLNIEPAEAYPRATEHISEMVALVQKLLDKGFAYKGDDDSIYYKVREFQDYGKLSHLDLSALKNGASGRVKSDEYGKDEARDFVLWKAYGEDDGEVFWETPLGKGRPGWHLECSAMSVKYLGESFDLHAGGVDLIFPHHENEIAQSEAASGKEFAWHWAHCEHLLVEGRKMSKSAGNFYTLRGVFAKGHSPRSVRWLLLTTHYRSQLNFTFKALEQAENTIKKLDGFVDRVMSSMQKDGASQEIDEAIERASKGFEEALDDDLEISQALPHLFELIRIVNASIDSGNAGGDSLARVLEFLKRADSILGVMQFTRQEFDAEVLALAGKREEARKNKDYAESDRIRDLLKEKGYSIQDTPNGPKLSRVSS